MGKYRFVTRLALAIAVVAGLVSPTFAGEQVPFKGHLEGSHTSRTPIGWFVVFDRFETEGTATFTAANGDTLVADFVGSSALVLPGFVLITENAVIDPVASTRRFAGANGTFSLNRLADAATGVTGVTIGSFEGAISSPGRNDVGSILAGESQDSQARIDSSVRSMGALSETRTI